MAPSAAWRIAPLCLCLVLAVPALAQQHGPTLGPGLGMGTAEAPVDEWPVADPAALGLDTTALAEHAALCEASAATACLVVYRGHVVQEWKASDYDYGPHVGLASATKSLTGLLPGGPTPDP